MECEDTVDIHGTVESATVISRTGMVFVRGGVVGKRQAHIFGKKGIYADFAQDAKLETDGTLTIVKHCLHCDCTCAVFDGTAKHCTIVGGSVRATEKVEVSRLGNEQGVETRIVLIDRRKLLVQEKISELEKLKAQLVEQLTPAAKQVQSKATILKKAGEVATERQHEEMKKWIENLEKLSKKAKYVQQKIDELRRSLDFPPERPGFLKVTGDVFPGVVLTLYEVSRVICEPVRGKCFRLTAEGIID